MKTSDGPFRALAEQMFGPSSIARRDLGNAHALMLRPRGQPWFHAKLSDVVWVDEGIDPFRGLGAENFVSSPDEDDTHQEWRRLNDEPG